MRKIKFRGLHINGWRFGIVDDFCDKFLSPSQTTLRYLDEELRNVTSVVRKNTVGEFTGIIVNGEELFEGDILGFEDYGDVVITFDKGAFGYETEMGFVTLSESNLSIAKIVGNIHE